MRRLKILNRELRLKNQILERYTIKNHGESRKIKTWRNVYKNWNEGCKSEHAQTKCGVTARKSTLCKDSPLIKLQALTQAVGGPGQSRLQKYIIFDVKNYTPIHIRWVSTVLIKAG